VASAPDFLTLKRNRDEAGRHEPAFRRIGLGLVALLLVLGLLNVFGQRPSKSRTFAVAANLTIEAPKHLRSGLIYQSSITVQARHELRQARLVLDRGWIEGITINSIEPSPVGEASDDGSLSFTVGHVPAGKSYVLFLQQQVNPTTFGRRSQSVELADGAKVIARISRTATIYP
jgi:hypothetical protein